jgi:hypothetical protein
MPKATGGQPYQNGNSTGCTVQPVESIPLTLSDMGLDKFQSHRFQLIASLPEPEFEAEIATTIARSQELTTSRMLKKARWSGAVIAEIIGAISTNQQTTSRQPADRNTANG